MATSKQGSTFLLPFCISLFTIALGSVFFYFILTDDIQSYGILTALLRLSSITKQKQSCLQDQPTQTLAQASNSTVSRTLQNLRLNGTTPCHHVATRSFAIKLPPELAVHMSSIEPLAATMDPTVVVRSGRFANRAAKVLVVSLDGNGTERCAGGDYYETDLSNQHWKSRPSVEDYGNGSYGVSLDFAGAKSGTYNFTVSLLYSNFHGFDHRPGDWGLSKSPETEISKTVRLELVTEIDGRCRLLQSDRICTAADMTADSFSAAGKWTRSDYNDSCEADGDGRFRHCINATCETGGGHCEGDLSILESNGWVYSRPNCRFHIWSPNEAWACLGGKWLFFWGDSNMQDMIRNVVLFGLGMNPLNGESITTWGLDREQDLRILNPGNANESLRITLTFNGHHQPHGNNLGLDCLHDQQYQEKVRQLFTNSSTSLPDALVFNTGLHDGIRFRSYSDFISAVERATTFWAPLLSPSTSDGPVFIHRFNVAPAGESRFMASNPPKMEAYNAALLSHFHQLLGSQYRFIDSFDASFPFHFDHSCSDGGHYGRAPKSTNPPWFGRPHQYFVDVMLVHMMFTAMCHLPS